MRVPFMNASPSPHRDAPQHVSSDSGRDSN